LGVDVWMGSVLYCAITVSDWGRSSIVLFWRARLLRHRSLLIDIVPASRGLQRGGKPRAASAWWCRSRWTGARLPRSRAVQRREATARARSSVAVITAASLVRASAAGGRLGSVLQDCTLPRRRHLAETMSRGSARWPVSTTDGNNIYIVPMGCLTALGRTGARGCGVGGSHDSRARWFAGAPVPGVLRRGELSAA
jgi:hypothetical protein